MCACVDLGLVGLLQMCFGRREPPKYVHPELSRQIVCKYLECVRSGDRSGGDTQGNTQWIASREGLQIVPEWGYRYGLFRYSLQTRLPRAAVPRGCVSGACVAMEQRNAVTSRKRSMQMVPFTVLAQERGGDMRVCPVETHNEPHTPHTHDTPYTYIWLFHERDGLFSRYDTAAEDELESGFRKYLQSLHVRGVNFPSSELSVTGDTSDITCLARAVPPTHRASRATRMISRVLHSQICFESFKSTVRTHAASWDLCRVGVCLNRDVSGDTHFRQSIIMGTHILQQYGGADDVSGGVAQGTRRRRSTGVSFDVSYRELSFLFRMRATDESLGVGELIYKPRKLPVDTLSRVFQSLLVCDSVGASGETFVSCDGTAIEPSPKKRRIPDASESVAVLVTSSSSSDHSVSAYDKSELCAICLDALCEGDAAVKLPKCTHWYHKKCIVEYVDRGGLKKGGIQCPLCATVQLSVFGPSPAGKMMWRLHRPGDGDICGYETCGSIDIVYSLPSGHQLDGFHPQPGKAYTGSVRGAWLPLTQQGLESLLLLSKAFLAGQTFKFDTTDDDVMIAWNWVPHKVNRSGGGQFGFPDPEYFDTLKTLCGRHGIVLSELELSQAQEAFKYYNGIINNTRVGDTPHDTPLDTLVRQLRPELRVGDLHISLPVSGDDTVDTPEEVPQESSDEDDNGDDEDDDEEEEEYDYASLSEEEGVSNDDDDDGV
eukprot:Blabericola_migrator_1__2479@NODE_169_length_12121_cov_125_483906_g147_i0_p1_GENE_NODE_169_length_12121_cov_125_483906_g147_i0NODE_169_length_12121_cov_125_483906_g147_i0_p1_ORF_typecomplete_len714_score171_54DTC/PF18102_1/2_3e25zfRING_2/PF13639_6/1_3e03zfRING_2/PF13639_6/1_6e09zfRING_2/PF13639_6/8_4e03zfRING_11/PF17123_5/1_4e03zfRING_11/PF17123_5/1_3e07zfC3HC4/PF00097_25/4_9e02zfC3HC4/PF00097_25/1_8e07zfC3HC4_2/PF13923_6/2_1e02zfC3HC4_2/PF13923_6/1_9e05zfRING_5/PF14634_6/9_5e02zfRING_5/PF14634_